MTTYVPVSKLFPPSVLVGFRECWSGATSTDQLSDNPGLTIDNFCSYMLWFLYNSSRHWLCDNLIVTFMNYVNLIMISRWCTILCILIRQVILKIQQFLIYGAKWYYDEHGINSWARTRFCNLQNEIKYSYLWINSSGL